MRLSIDNLRQYVETTAGTALPRAALERLANACEAATGAVNAAASDSLFDTEPEQLHTVLTELAGGRP